MRTIRFVHSLLFALVLLALMTLAMASPSFAQLAVSINLAPPSLPVYEQPVIPGPGYLWAPGYWAWNPQYEAYYWVPGTWVLPPQVGVLWTPGYWGWGGNAFSWNPGYWGPHIGFYGGVNYGFGYTGSGYEGGYWNNGAFFYNRSVNNVPNVTNITNVYNKTVINNVTINNVSYNGGKGGTTARPTPAQLAVARERHIPPTVEQTQQQQAASTNRMLLASVNHGKPPIAATAKPGVLSGRGSSGARAKAAAPYHAAALAEQRRVTPAPMVRHEAPAPMVRHETPAPMVRHEAPAPMVRHEAPAPMVRHEAPAPMVRHEAPAPMVRHEAPAPMVRHEAPAPMVRHEAPAPMVRHEAPAPMVRHEAPAPMVRHEAPAPMVRHEAPAPARVVRRSAPPQGAPHPSAHQAITCLARLRSSFGPGCAVARVAQPGARRTASFLRLVDVCG